MKKLDQNFHSMLDVKAARNTAVTYLWYTLYLKSNNIIEMIKTYIKNAQIISAFMISNNQCTACVPVFSALASCVAL